MGESLHNLLLESDITPEHKSVLHQNWPKNLTEQGSGKGYRAVLKHDPGAVAACAHTHKHTLNSGTAHSFRSTKGRDKSRPLGPHLRMSLWVCMTAEHCGFQWHTQKHCVFWRVKRRADCNFSALERGLGAAIFALTFGRGAESPQRTKI